MILTTSLIARAAINSLVPSIIDGVVNLYTSNKEQDYKNQSKLDAYEQNEVY